jgi:PAS domain S-box-containing protein
MSIQESPQVSSFSISQQELVDLLDNLPSMVSIINKDLVYEFCNKTFIKNSQQQYKEIVGKQIQETFPDAFKTLKEYIAIVLNGKEITFQEELVINNKKIIADVKFTPRYDKEGNVNGYFSYMKDITNEKKVENRLVESKERLNLIQSLAKVGGWHYDFKSHKTWWSKGTYNIFKVNEEEEITFDKFLSYLPKNDQQQLLDNWSKSIQQRTDFNINHQIVNGNHVASAKGLATFFYDDDGQPLYAIGAVIDITEAEIAQRKLRESEERFELAIEGTNAGTWDWDIETGKIVYNEKWANIIGYTLEELQPIDTNTWVKFTHPEDFEYASKLHQEHFEGKNSYYECEIRMKHKNGEWIWIQDSGKVFSRSEDGHPIRMAGTHIDITKRKNAEIELNSYKENLKELIKEQTKELKEINVELEAFAYSISHDLRTPLRYIEGFSKLLKRRIVINDEETERYFSHISEGIQNMSAMIDALLNFSRLGRRAIEKEVVDMNEVIAEAIKEFTHVCNEREIKWEIGKLPIISGDPALILMVFENLISNAIKFTKDKDEAIIEIQPLEIPDQKGKTTISVKDNGVGFDMEYSDKLFGVFQRLHSQEEFEGTGIGLANVKKIIDKHGGSIRIDAEEERGATFYITL